MSKLEEYGKNNFAEGSKILLDTDLKIIAVLFVRKLKENCKILSTCQNKQDFKNNLTVSRIYRIK